MKPFRSYRHAALVAVLAALASPTVAGAAASVANVTDATTGMNDAGSLIAQDACPPPTSGRATCEAAFLAMRSNHAPAHPSLRRASSPDHVVAHGASGRAGTATEPVAAPAPQPGTPAYLQQAYDLSYLSQTAGGSDTVAIVDAYDDPTAESDLATYRANFDLPPCTTQNGCFRKVNQTGGQTYPAPDAGWAVEMSLDLDSVSALCPNCHIILVEANSNSFSDLLAAEAEADALGAKQISDSWAGASSSPLPGSYTFPGVATVAATGDNGYDGPGWDAYPAALPGVNAAGGTTLVPSSSSLAANPRGFTDSAWSGGGSGCDMAEAKPAWQSDTGCTGRSYADLSADADPNTGMIIYDTGQGGWLVVGGTSEATPLISAFFAVTGANASSPAWAHQNAELLNDPQTGSNGSCAASISYICNARAGYDGPTGAGSISGAVVAGAPGIGGPGASGSYAHAVSTTSATLAGGVYPNGKDTSYWWEYGTTTGYGQQTTTADVGSGAAPVAVNGSLTALQPNTAYHYRLVAQNSFGTSYGYDYTFTTPGPTPTVGGLSATPTSTTAATLSGTVNPEGTAGAGYYFDYGTTSAYGHSTALTSVSGTSNVAASAAVTGLTPGTTYHYRLSVGPTGNYVRSADETFTTPAALPVVSNATANVTGSTTASLTGTVNPDGASSASYFFAYGIGNLAQWTTPASISGSSNTAVSAALTGLAPGTTYTYTLIVETGNERVAYPNQTFTTLVPPTVTAASATATGSSTATLSASINVQQASTTSYYFSYGTTTAYGQSSPTATVSGTGSVPVSQNLTGLKSGTTYHYNVTIVSNLGTVTFHDQTFTTPGPPTVSNASASVNGTATATLSGTVNADLGQATYHFVYGTTAEYGQSTPSQAVTGNAATAVSASLTGLAPGTTYHYTLTITSPYGTVSYPDQVFTTAVPPTVVAANATAIATTVATLTGTVNPGGAPSSHYYFSYGTTTGYGRTTASVAATGGSNGSATTGLTGLTSGTTYHYTLTIVTADGTVASYRDQTFTTLALPTVSSASGAATGPTTASLTGTVNPKGSTSATYFFAYGPGNLSQWTTPVSVSGSSDTPVTATLSGLAAGTTYEYALIIETNTDRVSYADQTFTTPAAPTVTAVSASVTGVGVATLTGTVNPAGQSSYSFSYGTTSAYGQATAPTTLTGSSSTAVSKQLTGLQTGTTYHYTLKVTNSYGTVTYKDQTFTMPAPPVVSNATANVTGSTTATLTGAVNAELGQATYSFSYGTTSGYGHTTTSAAAGNASATVSAALTGLTPGTTYHYTLTITSSAGTFTYPDQIFTTLALPTMASASGSATGATTATFNGTVNPEGSTTATYFFAYGIGNLAHWTNPAPITGTSNTSVNAIISGLTPGATYEYTLIVQTGDERVSYPNQTFTTP